MALDIICNANDPQEDGRILAFASSGAPPEQQFIRGDINLALSVRPVVESATGERPWEDDFVTGDTFQVSIGNPDEAPTGGTFTLTALGGTVTSSSVANPSVILHAVSVVTLATGNTVYISGHTGSIPDINGAHVITVSDATHFTIPVNVTTGGTGGSFYLAPTGLAAIPYNVTTTALAAALAVAPLTAPTVTLVTTGVYDARWASGVSAPTFASPLNALAPASSVAIIDDSGADVQVRIIDLKQEPVAYSEPSTLFPSAGVTATIKQAGSGTANKIYAVSFDAAGTYGGSYAMTFSGVAVALTAAGLFTPSSTAEQIQTALETLSQVGDFGVTKDSAGIVTIEMRGTQALSNTPVIAVTNINLLAPKGVSGTMALNTTNLYRAFWNTTEDTLTFTLEIRRSRVSGEQASIFQHSVVLKRNIIDGVIVPTVLAAYYTTAEVYTKGQVDAIIAALPSGGTMASQDADNVNITGGTIDGCAITNVSGDFSIGGNYTGGTFNSVTVDGTSAIAPLAGLFLLGEVNGGQLAVYQNKSVSIHNTLIFTGVDGSTINFGPGGTLGTGAFAAAVVGANPTQSAGLTAVNGSATTYMRSDGAPAIDQSISPTWSSPHIFSAQVTLSGIVSITPANHSVIIAPTGSGTHSIDNMAVGLLTPAAIVATSLGVSGLSSFEGGLQIVYSQKTAGYSIAATDYAIELTANTATFTLPTAVGRIGQPYLVSNSGSGVLTLSTSGGQTINGLSTVSLSQGAAFQVTSNGTGWIITGSYGASSAGSFTTLTASGATTFTAGTTSSSTTTGTVVITGGLGVSGAINAASFGGATVTTVSDITTNTGNIVVSTAGKGVTVKGGTSGRIGSAVLVGGTKAVTCTNITTSTKVFLQRSVAGGVLGTGGYTYTISAGASFTINSVDTAGVLSTLDTSTLDYFLVELT